MDSRVNICGCKLIELPFLKQHLVDGDTLVVGERDGAEGVISTVLEKITKDYWVDATDVNPVEKGSIVEDLVKDFRIDFHECNFLDFSNRDKYENVVCINVLEHFGMCWNDNSDVMHWNWDLEGIRRMMTLTKNQIIITVPAGPPIFFGDTLKSGLPFLRRYDLPRMEIIRNLIKEKGFNIKKDCLYFSPDLVQWQEMDFSILNQRFANAFLESPNLIWGLVIG